jgi:hypothetical protein
MFVKSIQQNQCIIAKLELSLEEYFNGTSSFNNMIIGQNASILSTTTWLDDACTVALAEMYGVQIRIFSTIDDNWHIYGVENTNIVCIANRDNQHYYSSRSKFGLLEFIPWTAEYCRTDEQYFLDPMPCLFPEISLSYQLLENSDVTSSSHCTMPNTTNIVSQSNEGTINIITHRRTSVTQLATLS